MSHAARTMQDRYRPAARLTIAGALSLAGGCAAGTTALETPPASLPSVAAVGAVTPVSFQQDEGGEAGDFFDPLLDAPAESSSSSTEDDDDRGEFFDPLLDGPGDAGDAETEPSDTDEPAGDGTDAAPTIGFAEAVSLAVARAPRAEAARRRADAIAARLPQVTALDDPTVSSTSYPIRDQSLQTAGGRIQTGVQLAQRFPWPEKLDARGEVVRREVQVALTEVASAELAAALSARTAWWEAWYAGRAVAVTRRNRELLEQLSDVALARVRTGGAQTDVLRAELEIDRLDDRLLELRRAEDVARADLAAALRIPPGAPLPTAADELPPLNAAAELDALFAAAQRCRPELRRVRWEIAAGRARRQVACLAGKPDFTAGLGYAVVTEEDALAGVANGRDNVSILFGMSLPIYRDKIRAGVAEAEQRIAADARAFDAETDETLRLIRRLAVRLETLADRLALLEDRTLPRAERTLDVSLADYRGDRVGFTEVANSYGDLLRLGVQEARLRADAGIALAELERAVGCELPAAPIAVLPEPAPMPEPLKETLDAPEPLPLPNGDEPVVEEDEGVEETANAIEPAADANRGWRKARPRRS